MLLGDAPSGVTSGALLALAGLVAIGATSLDFANIKVHLAERERRLTRIVGGIFCVVGLFLVIQEAMSGDAADEGTNTSTSSTTTATAPTSASTTTASRPDPAIGVQCMGADSEGQTGTEFDLTYEITSDDTSAIQVGLGAGFYSEAGDDLSTGFGDVNSAELQPGSNRIERRFVIPDDTDPGRYELIAEIWPADRVGDDGADVLAEAQCGVVRVVG